MGATWRRVMSRACAVSRGRAGAAVLLAMLSGIDMACAQGSASQTVRKVSVPSTFQWTLDGSPQRQEFLLTAGKITVVGETNSYNEGPLIEFSAPGAQTVSFYAGEQPLGMAVSFRADRLDTAHSAVDVIASWYSGGAHCCTQVRIASLIGRTWKIVDLGGWDGDDPPKPRTGPDGVNVLPMRDNAFLYAFASYASSGTPLKILRLLNASITDVSAEPGYRPWFREDMEKWQRLCTDPGQPERNGFCAAFVASAARAGQFQEAWSVMLKNHTPLDPGGLTFCARYSEGDCQRDVHFTAYPEALRWFLRQRRYI